MATKAVDVVLLPEEAVANKAIEANAKLVEEFSPLIILNKEDCLPHISLAMGCVNEEDIPAIGGILRTIAKESTLGILTITGIRITGAGSKVVSSFEIEKTKPLQSFHEKVTDSLAPYFSYDVTADMLADAEVEERTLQWISGFREKSSYDKFTPHITIGYGEIEDLAFAISFVASKLALCQLGNHCTCRRILACVEL